MNANEDVTVPGTVEEKGFIADVRKDTDTRPAN